MAQSRRNDQTRVVLLIAAIVAVVAVIGVVVALVTGDDGDPDEEAFRPVTVTGEPLPPFQSTAGDPAVGLEAPVVSGVDYVGNEVTIDAGTNGPTMVVLLAHWCPHCNAEIPVLNEWRDSGEVPEGLNVVGVSTAASSDAPNFPPDQWLAEMDWQWPVVADDEPSREDVPPPAMGAYGGTGFPTMVFIDGEGRVFRRISGEVPIDVLAPLVDELLAASPS